MSSTPAVQTFAVGADQDFPSLAMFEDVGGKLSCDKSDPPAVGIAKSLTSRHLGRSSPRLRYLALVLYSESDHQLFQRAMTTLVPSPGFD